MAAETERVAADPGGCHRDDAVDLPVWCVLGPELDGAWRDRHMHEFGTTREQIAQIGSTPGATPQLNPKAVISKG